MRSKRFRLPLLGVACALILSQAAAADRLPVSFNAPDLAAVRAAVLKKGDLGGTAGWTGGLSKPDFTPSPCGGYDPKRSDLLVTGAATSEWRHTSGVAFMTDVWVMKTPAMMKLDWQRSVERPGYVTCLFKKAFVSSTGTKMISFKQTAFAKLAPLSRRYRMIIEYTQQAPTMRVVIDAIVIGKGRTELTFITLAPYAQRRAIEAAELPITRMLVARATA